MLGCHGIHRADWALRGGDGRLVLRWVRHSLGCTRPGDLLGKAAGSSNLHGLLAHDRALGHAGRDLSIGDGRRANLLLADLSGGCCLANLLGLRRTRDTDLLRLLLLLRGLLQHGSGLGGCGGHGGLTVNSRARVLELGGDALGLVGIQRR